ncbi:Mad3/BUB1 homology region 1-domain-containing protein [Amylocystis lapponica]|nr:Mad3/BUB1 homology region 1-domain-containing protein [Amylocystis lapponica]
MTDVFDADEPTIVDGDVLEAAKENIQPLASGRRVTALSAILSTPHAQREGRLSAARNRLRINVEVALEDDDDDPLEAYCRFVYWTVENYPQGHSAESGLLELLEEATRVLKDDRGGTWRDDMRYLKLWVLYANYVEKPAIIYRFLLANEIGATHALLYEEFATVLERAGRRTEADDAYMLGIARKAAPIERLENKHREFQKRMMSSTNLAPAAPSDLDASSSTSAASRRPALAEAATTTTATRTRSTRAPSIRNPPAAPTPAPAITPSTGGPRANARLQIFVDPSGSADSDPSALETPWPELGTRKSRVKENIPEVSKAAGTKLRQAGRAQRAAVAAAPKMAVYRDPEPGAEGAEDGEMPPPLVSAAKKDESGKGKGKSVIPVFRDEDAGAGASTGSEAPPVPSTPKFTPYRDEEPETPSGSASTVPASVMKVKAVGTKREGLGVIEAEALRKDPFKNYSVEEKPIEF